MKIVCQICNFHSDSSELLLALNPFDQTEPIHGCPKCKSINTHSTCCEGYGCWDIADCGTPTSNGYKRLCSLHWRLELQRQDYEVQQKINEINQ